MTHDENVHTFDDISRLLELEAKLLEATKASGSAFVDGLTRADHLGLSEEAC